MTCSAFAADSHRGAPLKSFRTWKCLRAQTFLSPQADISRGHYHMYHCLWPPYLGVLCLNYGRLWQQRVSPPSSTLCVCVCVPTCVCSVARLFRNLWRPEPARKRKFLRRRGRCQINTYQNWLPLLRSKRRGQRNSSGLRKNFSAS